MSKSSIGKFEQLQTVAKLLNTDSKVLMDFFVDVGFEILATSQLELLKALQTHLNNFIQKIESEKS